MVDLSFLKQPLPAAESPGIDGLDPRFVRICDLAEHARYEEAAAEIEQLIDAKVYDIRLLVYYLYQAFVEGGVGALADVLEHLRLLIESSWSAVGPAAKRERYFDRSLAWLFQKVLDSLVYYEQKNDETWARWTRGLRAERVQTAVEQGERLGRALDGPAYVNSGNTLAALTRWLRERRDTVAAAEAAEEAGAETEAKPAPKASAAGTAPAVPIDGAGGAQGEPAAPGSRGPTTVQLEVSHHFIELARKLRAFERLIARREFAKAALVSDDIQATIESFDPRRYFPRMFSAYCGLVSEHVDQLSPHWDDRDSVGRKALEQFYRVDLDRFVGEE